MSFAGPTAISSLREGPPVASLKPPRTHTPHLRSRSISCFRPISVQAGHNSLLNTYSSALQINASRPIKCIIHAPVLSESPAAYLQYQEHERDPQRRALALTCKPCVGNTFHITTHISCQSHSNILATAASRVRRPRIYLQDRLDNSDVLGLARSPEPGQAK